MTPPRLVQLKCPRCASTHWTIDSDYRGIDGIYIDYAKRNYQCLPCGYSEAGYTVLQKSPTEFLLQPHPMYPMRWRVFDCWADILKSNFPDHPLVKELGKEFRPNSQVFLTKLRNGWRAWKGKQHRRMTVIRVDMEDWLDGRLPNKPDDSPRDRAFKLSQPINQDPNSVNIFVSYSHTPNDSSLVLKLVDSLSTRLWKRRKVVEIQADQQVAVYRSAVTIWCDRTVTTSTGWQDELDESQFQSANFILLIVSPDYLASDYCRRQMNRAEGREQTGSAKLIPVILCPVEWQPPAHWKLLPTNGQPVTNWPNRDEAFHDIAEGLLQAIPAEVQKEWGDWPLEQDELRNGPL